MFRNTGRACIYILLSTLLMISTLHSIDTDPAFLTQCGDSFGILAPMVTGYLMNSTGGFAILFAGCGVLVVLRSRSVLLLAKHATIGKAALPLATAPAPA